MINFFNLYGSLFQQISHSAVQYSISVNTDITILELEQKCAVRAGDVLHND